MAYADSCLDPYKMQKNLRGFSHLANTFSAKVGRKKSKYYRGTCHSMFVERGFSRGKSNVTCTRLCILRLDELEWRSYKRTSSIPVIHLQAMAGTCHDRPCGGFEICAPATPAYVCKQDHSKYCIFLANV